MDVNDDAIDIDTWPPKYTLKRHSRVRHVKLKASQDGLEILIPLRFNPKFLPEILEKNREWIKQKLLEIQIPKPKILPEIISLQAINQTWRISYIKTTDKCLKLFIRPQQEIVLIGDFENKKKCFALLNEWLINHAKQHLVACLQHLSLQTNLHFNSVIIRGQKSRWGSCTSNKKISLNYKLLFLPPKLMKHILIHELCHTVYLNHSDRFWDFVATFDPE